MSRVKVRNVKGGWIRRNWKSFLKLPETGWARPFLKVILRGNWLDFAYSWASARGRGSRNFPVKLKYTVSLMKGIFFSLSPPCYYIITFDCIVCERGRDLFVSLARLLHSVDTSSSARVQSERHAGPEGNFFLPPGIQVLEKFPHTRICAFHFWVLYKWQGPLKIFGGIFIRESFILTTME